MEIVIVALLLLLFFRGTSCAKSMPTGLCIPPASAEISGGIMPGYSGPIGVNCYGYGAAQARPCGQPSMRAPQPVVMMPIHPALNTSLPMPTGIAPMANSCCNAVEAPLGVVKSVAGAAPGPIAGAIAVAAGGVLTGYEYLKSLATTSLTTAIRGTGPAKTPEQYYANPALSGGAPQTLDAVKIAQKFTLGLPVSAAEWDAYQKVYGGGCQQAIWNYYPKSFPGGMPTP